MNEAPEPPLTAEQFTSFFTLVTRDVTKLPICFYLNFLDCIFLTISYYLPVLPLNFLAGIRLTSSDGFWPHPLT